MKKLKFERDAMTTNSMRRIMSCLAVGTCLIAGAHSMNNSRAVDRYGRLGYCHPPVDQTEHLGTHYVHRLPNACDFSENLRQSWNSTEQTKKLFRSIAASYDSCPGNILAYESAAQGTIVLESGLSNEHAGNIVGVTNGSKLSGLQVVTLKKGELDTRRIANLITAPTAPTAHTTPTSPGMYLTTAEKYENEVLITAFLMRLEDYVDDVNGLADSCKIVSIDPNKTVDRFGNVDPQRKAGEVAKLGQPSSRAIGSSDGNKATKSFLRNLCFKTNTLESKLTLLRAIDIGGGSGQIEAALADHTLQEAGLNAENLDYLRHCLHTEVQMLVLAKLPNYNIKPMTLILSLKDPCWSCTQLNFLHANFQTNPFLCVTPDWMVKYPDYSHTQLVKGVYAGLEAYLLEKR